MHLTDPGAAELAHLIATRQTSCVEVMTAYLERIERVNPQVNAIIALRDGDALLAEARRADTWDGPRGPLHGLPHAVKDLAEVAGLPWTGGSPLFRDRVGAVDDPFVSRLREAGALIIGKTNVPEFGYGSQTYNDVWGATRNPHDLTLTAGGSSGGAAAALAARLLPAADGSDYMGSLRNPAGFCNVLGLRPSRGRVPGPGFVAQMGEIGPMGRGIADVALLLSVLAGPDPAAPLTRTDPLDLSDLRPADLRGARIAWVGDLGGRLATEPGLLDVCRGALTVFTGLGAEVEDVVPAFDLDRLWDAFLTWRAWAATDLPPGPLKPEAEWERARGAALTVAALNEAMAVRDDWFASVGTLFETYDAVLAPSAQVFPFPVDTHWPASIDGRPMDTYHRWMETVLPWSMAGVPVLGMPAGFDPAGRPAGVQLVGPPGADRRVLEIGLAYEQATGWVERARPLEDPPTTA